MKMDTSVNSGEKEVTPAVLSSLQAGRNELALRIDGIDFHVLYHRSDVPATEPRPFVILSHALMADQTMWHSTTAALCKVGYDVLTYDHIGHGSTGKQNTSWKDRKWHFDDFSRHMHQMMEATRPGELPTAVVGCSMGGVLAVRYAMMFGIPRRHDKVSQSEQGRQANSKKLSIVCIGAPGMKTLEPSIPKWEERKKLFREEGVHRLAHITAERWFPEPVPPGLRERVEEMCKSTSLQGYERCAEAIVNYDYESRGQLEELQSTPHIDVLVIRGENDEAVGPKSILQDVATQTGGRFVEMGGVGHLSPMHGPAEFEKILIEFLKG